MRISTRSRSIWQRQAPKTPNIGGLTLVIPITTCVSLPAPPSPPIPWAISPGVMYMMIPHVMCIMVPHLPLPLPFPFPHHTHTLFAPLISDRDSRGGEEERERLAPLHTLPLATQAKKRERASKRKTESERKSESKRTSALSL